MGEGEERVVVGVEGEVEEAEAVVEGATEEEEEEVLSSAVLLDLSQSGSHCSMSFSRGGGRHLEGAVRSTSGSVTMQCSHRGRVCVSRGRSRSRTIGCLKR